MKLAIEHGLFARELPGWALRGILCALPSAFWAAITEFNQPIEFAAMAVGTVGWIAVFALFSASEVRQANDGRARFVRALKMAAWMKAALLPGGQSPGV